MNARRRLKLGAALLPLVLCFPQGVASQTGRIEGTVRDVNSRNPIANARVSLVDPDLFAITSENGYYAIQNVPTGVFDVRVQAIGYQAGIFTNQRVTAGLPATVNFDLTPSVLRIEGIVVTGVAEATAAVKLPFTVEQVGRDEFPVPAQTAEEALRGKVAGVRVLRGDGRPGNEVSVLLRGVTSLDSRGRSNEPLYVVDGVILGASMVDIDALDIDNIEVVKGAAAAALYGARAANGVISISTRRGNDLPDGETRLTARTEFGRNALQRTIPKPQHHFYLQNENGDWLDADGTVLLPDTIIAGLDTTIVTPWEQRVEDWVLDSTFQDTDGDATADAWVPHRYAVTDNPYTSPTYDNLELFFNPGTFYTNSLTLAHRTGTTSLRISAHESKESGIIEGLDGYVRRGLRVNIAHAIARKFDFHASTYYSQSVSDEFNESNSPFYALAFSAPDVKFDTLSETPRDSVDFLDLPGGAGNPLYLVRNSDMERRRSRAMGSLGLRWRPTTWVDLSTDLSYDRSDQNQTEHFFKGHRRVSEGMLNKWDTFSQAINASASATITRSFGDFSTLLKARALLERSKLETFSARAAGLVVTDAKDLDLGNPDADQVSGSSSDVRSLGYFLSSQLDYDEKLIADLLFRRDGSSLFGEDERWHTYYRASGAYRMSQEPFWPFQFLNEFKLRYSIGTAGGRPRFDAQYETFELGGGLVTKQNLGNRSLKPERATEQEFGVDIMAWGLATLELSHVRTTVADQILLVPLIDYYGFDNQWRNAGELNTRVWEGTLQASLVQTADASWTLNVVVDRTRQRINSLDVDAFSWGYFYIREGEEIGSMYGTRIASTCADIRTSGGLGISSVCEAFDLNDDGYLVPVGAGNSYTDGIEKNLYGSKLMIDGVEFDWGLPVASFGIEIDTLPNGAIITDTTNYLRIGNTQPDLNLGFTNTLRWKGFSLHTLFDAQIGGQIYNHTRFWPYRDLYAAADVDQSEKPENQRKPIEYYSTLYMLGSSDHFVEDGSYLKFRELSIGYTLSRRQLEGLFGRVFNRLTLSVIGRNLYTWTHYSGYDPEVSAASDGAIYRVDSFGYPNYRTWTGAVEIEF